MANGEPDCILLQDGKSDVGQKLDYFDLRKEIEDIDLIKRVLIKFG